MAERVACRRDRMLQGDCCITWSQRRLGERRAEFARIPHKSTNYTAEIPSDRREALPLVPVPMWDHHLLSQHTVFELQIALGLPAGHAVSGGTEPRLGSEHYSCRRA